MNLIEDIEFTATDLTKFGLLLLALVSLIHITLLSLVVVLPVLVVMLYHVIDEMQKGTLLSNQKK